MQIIGAIVAGGLLGSAFLSEWLWWLVVPGIVLTLALISGSRNTKQAFWIGLVIGVTHHLLAWWWIWSIYPLNWLGVTSTALQIGIIFFYWFGVAFVLGCGLGVTATILRYVFTRLSVFVLLLVPLLWVASEVLGSALFTLYSWGPGSTYNVSFSFGYVGYPVADVTWLLPAASVFGVYGLSWLVALAGVVLLVLLRSVRRPEPQWFGAVGVICSVVLVSNFTFYDREVVELGTTVISVETRFSPEYLGTSGGFAAKKQAVEDAVMTSLTYVPDTIVLPEDSRLTEQLGGATSTLRALQLKNQGTKLVVDSARTRISPEAVVLRAYVYDLVENRHYEVDKQYLVPQGEFIPDLARLWLNYLGQEALIAKIERDQSYVPGPKQVVTLPDSIPPVLFCMESVSPYGIKQLLQERSSTFVIHPVAHGWFNDSKILELNLDRMLKIQAVWNDVSVLQTGNMTTNQKLVNNRGALKVGERLEGNDTWQLLRY